VVVDELSGAKEMADPDLSGAKETAEPDLSGAKETAEPDLSGAKETAEPDLSGAKETAEPDLSGAKETAEPDLSGAKETAEPDLSGAKETVDPGLLELLREAEHHFYKNEWDQAKEICLKVIAQDKNNEEACERLIKINSVKGLFKRCHIQSYELVRILDSMEKQTSPGSRL